MTIYNYFSLLYYKQNALLKYFHANSLTTITVVCISCLIVVVSIHMCECVFPHLN